MKTLYTSALRFGAAAAAFGAIVTLTLTASTPATKVRAALRSSHAPSITLYAFEGGATGSFPLAGVTADRAGNLYGTTQLDGNGPSCAVSGLAGCGVVYRLTRSGSMYTETVLHSFQGAPGDGALPGVGSLTGDASGVLYGTTLAGGSGACTVSGLAGCGTAFKLTPSGSTYVESVLHDFMGGRDGAEPLAGLIEDASGALFGATQDGGRGHCSTSGAAGCGTIFKLTPSTSGYSETILYAFKGATDGSQPIASLIEDAAGNLYGTTFAGGGGAACAIGCGTVFKLTPASRGYTEKVLYRFVNPSHGLHPQGGLMLDASGALYGTTLAGGTGACSASGSVAGCGTVYKLTPKGARYAQSVIYAFQGAPNDGSAPSDPLVERRGVLYGTTFFGGDVSPGENAGAGTVFALTPSGSKYTESILYLFGSNARAGRLPLAGLTAFHGALYGTTYTGGRGQGTVFKL